jgi:hypothetical protein
MLRRMRSVLAGIAWRLLLRRLRSLPGQVGAHHEHDREIVLFWRREGRSEWLGAGPDRTMLSTPRLARLLGGCADDSELIADLLADLGAFTGAGWEQDDDTTAGTRRAVGRRGHVPVAPGRDGP